MHRDGAMDHHAVAEQAEVPIAQQSIAPAVVSAQPKRAPTETPLIPWVRPTT